MGQTKNGGKKYQVYFFVLDRPVLSVVLISQFYEHAARAQ